MSTDSTCSSISPNDNNTHNDNTHDNDDDKKDNHNNEVPMLMIEEVAAPGMIGSPSPPIIKEVARQMDDNNNNNKEAQQPDDSSSSSSSCSSSSSSPNDVTVASSSSSSPNNNNNNNTPATHTTTNTPTPTAAATITATTKVAQMKFNQWTQNWRQQAPQLLFRPKQRTMGAGGGVATTTTPTGGGGGSASGGSSNNSNNNQNKSKLSLVFGNSSAGSWQDTNHHGTEQQQQQQQQPRSRSSTASSNDNDPEDTVDDKSGDDDDSLKRSAWSFPLQQQQALSLSPASIENDKQEQETTAAATTTIQQQHKNDPTAAAVGPVIEEEQDTVQVSSTPANAAAAAATTTTQYPLHRSSSEPVTKSSSATATNNKSSSSQQHQQIAPNRSHSLGSSASVNSSEYDDDDDDSSFISSSAMGSSVYFTDDTPSSHHDRRQPQRLRLRHRRHSDFASNSSTTSGVSALQWAAASVVDSVQQYRGRYSYSGSGGGSHTRGGDLNNSNNEPSSHSNNNSTPVSANRRKLGSAQSSSLSAGQVSSSSSHHPSQMTRILSSPAADHFQSLQQGLAANEYIMLLGRGMLGVNLKQSYKKYAGCYVDYMVQAGAAEKCRVIHVGDIIRQVGENESVQKGTIWTVPTMIAAAKRPVHIVLSTAGPVVVEHMRPLDVAVAVMQQQITLNNNNSHNNSDRNARNSATCSSDASKQQSSDDKNVVIAKTPLPSVPLSDTESEDDDDDDTKCEDNPAISEQDGSKEETGNENDTGSLDGETGRASQEEEENNDEKKQEEDIMELVTPPSFDKEEDTDAIWDKIKDTNEQQEEAVVILPHNSVEAYVNPGRLPPMVVRQALLPHVIKRNNDEHLRNQPMSEMLQSSNVLAASLNAFLTTVMDPRAFPFLARYLAEWDNRPLNDDNDDDGSLASASSATDHPATQSSSAMLMLFLEMMNFTDLHGLTPNERRHEIASRIAHKYFLPTTVGGGAKKELVPPMFDFHQIVSDSSLRKLEGALNQGNITHDLFWDFQQAVAENLSGRPFVSFLVSHECARMRAYLRNTAPFINVPLHKVIDSLVQDSSQSSASNCPSTAAAAKNYFLYVLTYLFCLLDKEPFGEHDDLDADPSSGVKSQPGNRVEDAASGLCCAVFIRARLVPAIQQGQAGHLKQTLEQFWESFVAPGLGALSKQSQRGEVDEHMKIVVEKLQDMQQKGSTDSDNDMSTEDLIHGLTLDGTFLTSVQTLADELLYDYASNVHSKFRAHKFHEWICGEFNKMEGSAKGDDSMADPSRIGTLPSDCVKRLLRKADWPCGIAPHKPSHDVLTLSTATKENVESADISTALRGSKEENVTLYRCNAECAIVFGTAVGPDLPSEMFSPGMSENSSIRRYCCQSTNLEKEFDGCLSPTEVPPTLESYALVPESRTNPFNGYSCMQSEEINGWKASLVNFVVPRADVSADDGGESSLYGVSLVLRQTEKSTSKHTSPEEVGDTSCEMEESAALRKIKASISSPAFSKRLSEQPWTELVGKEDDDDEEEHIEPAVVGLALVSQRNVIFAMRETLSLLFREFVRSAGRSDVPTLVDLLGNFVHDDIEDGILLSILEPFLRLASSPWLERPVLAQKDAFERAAGAQLIKSIPPIPLALLFVTALLEQKIVVTSSRRSVLLSSTVALSALLKPLHWCHLLVPRVPVSLAADLLQYPAPFILGMPSEDQGMMELIRNLPEDVTLVDLDVGRVILAPSFAHDSELGRGTPNNADTARALRSQVLYLAQSLGNVFGPLLDPDLWMCDSACAALSDGPLTKKSPETHPFDALKSVCRDFVEEILAGSTSCCYWIEEAFSNDTEDARPAAVTEPTILFDEDRFFRVKNVREKYDFEPLFGGTARSAASRKGLALSLDNFDLVLELFLRCQSMNEYIGTRDRKDMAFSL